LYRCLKILKWNMKNKAKLSLKKRLLLKKLRKLRKELTNL